MAAFDSGGASRESLGHPPATPNSKRTLDYIRIEIQRAEDEDDEDTARLLREQYARLEKIGTTKPALRLTSVTSTDRSSSSPSNVERTQTTDPASPNSAHLGSPTSLSQLSAWPAASFSSGQAETPQPTELASHGDLPPAPNSGITQTTGQEASRQEAGSGGLDAIDMGGLVLEEHSNKVADRLFIGDLSAAVEPAIVKATGITHVVDLANTIDEHFETLGGSSKNVNYLVPREVGDWKDSCPSIQAKLVVRVDDTDEAPLGDHFDAVNAFVNDALYGEQKQGELPGTVLIHCFRGKSRSATSMIQYLMQFGCPPAPHAATPIPAPPPPPALSSASSPSSSTDTSAEAAATAPLPPPPPAVGVAGMTLKQALDAVKRARPVIQLNVGFRKLLMDLEAKLRPGEPPSVVLKLNSRKPVLSSALRRNSRSESAQNHPPPSSAGSSSANR